MFVNVECRAEADGWRAGDYNYADMCIRRQNHDIKLIYGRRDLLIFKEAITARELSPS